MDRKGFALATVLLIVIIVPIAVFGITFFITNSIVRYDAQTRSLKALYLAEAGIQRAIFNIIATNGTPLPVSGLDSNNTITVTLVASCSNIFQLKSVGTSISNGNSISRTVFAQYDSTANKVNLYLESDGTGVAPPTCCSGVWWPFNEGSGYTTGTAPYQGTLTPSNANGPAWVADHKGAAGQALNFNQGGTTNYVIVNDSTNSALDLTTVGTITAWIYIPSTFPITTDKTALVVKGNSTTDQPYGLVLHYQNVNYRTIELLLRSSNNGTQRLLAGPNNTGMAYDTWYHVAGSWGALGFRVYVNGALQASNATVYSSYVNNGALTIGVQATNQAGTRFRGRIDEVHVYACQKSDAEILAEYNATR